MAELTRNFDWSTTAVGSAEQWPQSLKTMVGVILSSRYPMFLWWGPGLVQFYNDAYRPTLGFSGKHPAALGQQAEDCWQEIWSVIKPYIDEVMVKGVSIWKEDQLIPIERNGKLEDVYWTFSYSPVRDDADEIAGVLVVCNETTGNVASLKKIKISDQRFQNLVQDATVGIIVLTGEEIRVDVVNEVYGKLIDRKCDELMGKPLFSIIPEMEEHFRPIIDRVRTTGEPLYLYDHPYFVWIDGQKKEGYLNLVYQAYKESNGTITGVMVLCHDVTESVMSRKKILESEQRVRSIVESAPFPIGVYVGKEKRIQFANQAILNAWGKGNDVIGRLFSEVLPELDNQEIFQQVDSVYSTGFPFHAKNQRVDLVVNGRLQPYYFTYSFTPLFNSLGQVYGVMNTAADVTDLNVANQKIKESERNLRNIVLQSPVAMCIFRGAAHVVEIANDRMLEIWGVPAEAIIGKSLFEELPILKEQGFEAMLQNVLFTGQAFKAAEVPVSVPRQDGFETVYVDFVCQVLSEGQEVVSGILAVAIDVTAQVIARRKIEESEAILQSRVEQRTEELRKVNKNLESTNKELEQFTYAASHDMQEPLRKVSTFTSMLLQRHSDALDSNAANYLEKIRISVDRMKTIINDLLNYSHQTREAQAFVQVDLNKVIADVEADFELMIQQKQAKITKDLLPHIAAVPSQISQLFLNLLNNALKFSKPGVPVHIRIGCITPSPNELAAKNLNLNTSYTKISFADNGIGFDQQYAEQIFSLFKRLHGKTEFEGTGIGLGLCKKIVQNHHGCIWAESQPGEGAIFKILLPL